MNRDGVENISAVHLPTTAGFVRRSAQRQQAVSIAAKVRLAPEALRRAVQTLSGGNQQKVVLAKWLAARSHVLILDEPTRGIDVGAKAEIYAIMRQLADEGLGILFISSELPEILGLSDRILVMRRGRIVAEFDAAEATEEAHHARRRGGGADYRELDYRACPDGLRGRRHRGQPACGLRRAPPRRQERGAQLVLFPECATTGYFVADRIASLAEPSRGPPANGWRGSRTARAST